MNRPITSYPCCRSSTADAELSTPPLIASTTRPGMDATSSQPTWRDSHDPLSIPDTVSPALVRTDP